MSQTLVRAISGSLISSHTPHMLTCIISGLMGFLSFHLHHVHRYDPALKKAESQFSQAEIVESYNIMVRLEASPFMTNVISDDG
jgi:hypothetical protein